MRKSHDLGESGLIFFPFSFSFCRVRKIILCSTFCLRTLNSSKNQVKARMKIQYYHQDFILWLNIYSINSSMQSAIFDTQLYKQIMCLDFWQSHVLLSFLIVWGVQYELKCPWFISCLSDLILKAALCSWINERKTLIKINHTRTTVQRWPLKQN